MAQEPKPSRPRPTSGGQSGFTEPAAAPITSNTPLPPLNPLPLPSEGAATDPGGPAAPDAGLIPPNMQATPTAYPPPPFGYPPVKPGASAQGVTPVWAVGSIFIILFVSLILLTVLAVSAANVSQNPSVPVWTMIIIIIANIVYALIVVNLTRGQGPLNVSFLRPRRGP